VCAGVVGLSQCVVRLIVIRVYYVCFGHIDYRRVRWHEGE
jgi:hypothetical protein